MTLIHKISNNNFKKKENHMTTLHMSRELFEQSEVTEIDNGSGHCGYR